MISELISALAAVEAHLAGDTEGLRLLEAVQFNAINCINQVQAMQAANAWQRKRANTFIKALGEMRKP